MTGANPATFGLYNSRCAVNELNSLTAGQVNSYDQNNIINTDTSLNCCCCGRTNFSDVLQSLIGAAPGLILLARTPQNKLPSVYSTPNGQYNQSGRPTLAYGRNPNVTNWTMILGIGIIAVLIIFLVTRR